MLKYIVGLIDISVVIFSINLLIKSKKHEGTFEIWLFLGIFILNIIALIWTSKSESLYIKSYFKRKQLENELRSAEAQHRMDILANSKEK